MRIGVDVVVHTVDSEPEKLKKFLLIACKIGELVEASCGDTFPSRSDGILNALLHFPIVEADATLLVEL